MAKKKIPIWYHTDSRGRKIGYMWPEDLLVLIESIWGYRKGIDGFARYAGFSRVAVERWCNGTNPIPRYVVILALSLEKLVHRWVDPGDVHRGPTMRTHRRDFPKLKPTWLPDEEQEKFRLDMDKESR